MQEDFLNTENLDLYEEIEISKKKLKAYYENMNFVSENLIDYYAYQIKAEQAKFAYLMKEIKKQNRRDKMKKEFELSLILGRYNHFHNGHKMLVDMSRKISRKTLILIGSSSISGTVRNPYNIELRRKLIEEIYGNCEDVIIADMEDLTNENDISYEWGDFLLENATKKAGRKPDLMIYGKDESRKGWFREEAIKDITEIIVSRNKIDISATKLRTLLAQDNYETWIKFVPKDLHKYYTELRTELLKIPKYQA